VEVFVPLPPGTAASAVRVTLTPTALAVHVGGLRVLEGPLFAPVKAEDSVWAIADGVLELQLLKRCRRGQYAAGATNADTFWYALLGGRSGRERLPLEHPPASYYKTEYEREGAEPHRLRGRSSKSRAL